MDSSGIPPEASFAEAPSRRWLVAFSGGLDSTVLLHWAAQFAATDAAISLRALHVHHGLNAAADDWAAHCARIADSLAVPLTVRRVQVDLNGGSGLEAAARAARFAAIREVMQPAETVLFAHHQDDQAETLLLNLARGSGPDGLSAMPRQRDLGAGWLYRPLLGLSRARLEAEAHAMRLSWIDDPSNRDESLDRNFLRHRVIPLLRERWPGFSDKAADATRRIAEITTQIREDDGPLLDSLTREGGLSVSALSQLEPAVTARVLRMAMRRAGLPLPGQAVLGQVLRVIQSGRNDAEHCVQWGRAEVRRYRDRLFIQHRLPEVASDWTTQWSGEPALQLPSGSGELLSGASGSWTVRLAQPTDVIRQPGRPGKRLAKWCQEQGIPPWLRLRLPVVLRDEWICSIGATCIDEQIAPSNLQWNHQLVGVPRV